jgi:uncharacterized membrane protein
MASNPTKPALSTFQAVSYQGVIPPPDMLEKFKKLDPTLPERLVRMAEISLENATKELEYARELKLMELGNQKEDLQRKDFEARSVSKYDFRAQIIIIAMVVIVLGVAVLLGMVGLSGIAYVVVAGGFATIVTAAIKGVSSQKQ